MKLFLTKHAAVVFSLLLGQGPLFAEGFQNFQFYKNDNNNKVTFEKAGNSQPAVSQKSLQQHKAEIQKNLLADADTFATAGPEASGKFKDGGLGLKKDPETGERNYDVKITNGQAVIIPHANTEVRVGAKTYDGNGNAAKIELSTIKVAKTGDVSFTLDSASANQGLARTMSVGGATFASKDTHVALAAINPGGNGAVPINATSVTITVARKSATDLTPTFVYQTTKAPKSNLVANKSNGPANGARALASNAGAPNAGGVQTPVVSVPIETTMADFQVFTPLINAQSPNVAEIRPDFFSVTTPKPEASAENSGAKPESRSVATPVSVPLAMAPAFKPNEMATPPALFTALPMGAMGARTRTASREIDRVPTLNGRREAVSIFNKTVLGGNLTVADNGFRLVSKGNGGGPAENDIGVRIKDQGGSTYRIELKGNLTQLANASIFSNISPKTLQNATAVFTVFRGVTRLESVKPIEDPSRNAALANYSR